MFVKLIVRYSLLLGISICFLHVLAHGLFGNKSICKCLTVGNLEINFNENMANSRFT